MCVGGCDLTLTRAALASLQAPSRTILSYGIIVVVVYVAVGGIEARLGLGVSHRSSPLRYHAHMILLQMCVGLGILLQMCVGLGVYVLPYAGKYIKYNKSKWVSPLGVSSCPVGMFPASVPLRLFGWRLRQCIHCCWVVSQHRPGENLQSDPWL